jgi:hypothetical protein
MAPTILEVWKEGNELVLAIGDSSHSNSRPLLSAHYYLANVLRALVRTPENLVRFFSSSSSSSSGTYNLAKVE